MLRVELGVKSTVGVQPAGIPCTSYLVGDTTTPLFEQDSQVSVRQTGFLQQRGS